MDSFALTKNRIIIIAAGAGIVLLVLALMTGVIPGLRLRPPKPPRVSFEVWGVFDSPQVFASLIDAYKKAAPNAEITYRELPAATYESELVNAMAAGTGPDAFMFHNTWLPKHIDKIAPVSETRFPFASFRDLFPQAVAQDFAPNGIIHASPLYLDTLVMFYNRDMFDRKAIPNPPQNWTDFQDTVAKLRELNPNTNEIFKAGAAIGGSEKSINRASDIVMLLMLQSGTQMVDSEFGEARFSRAADEGTNPGLNSLNFYTQFANPASPFYTWNENLHYSVDNFTEGGAGILFNYAHQIPIIKSKNPFLNFGIAPTPQITGTPQPVAYPNYWGLAASNKAKNPEAVWDFISFVTTDEAAADSYFKTTAKPPALKALINKNLNDPVWGVFVKQALIARSWPQINSIEVTKSFSSMIDAIITGRLPADEALRKAEDEITQLMRLKRGSNF